MELIDKDALISELKKRVRNYWSDSKNTMGIYPYALEEVIKYVDTLEVKGVDFDALGVLAKHLIACDAHGITPKYSDRELDFLEELANNKAQKGE